MCSRQHAGTAAGVRRRQGIGKRRFREPLPKWPRRLVVDVHLHDMRKCITSCFEHGHATAEVLDAILHHGRKGVTGTHYNFALYEKQVRKALHELTSSTSARRQAGGATANVVPLHA
jgi:hypothetical protein